MGCATSKQERQRQNCKLPYSPMPRSYSMNVYHPPQREGDSYHVVALTSSTLGSLKLHPFNQNSHSKVLTNPIENDDGKRNCDGDDDCEKRERSFSMGVIEEKTWSEMIEEKIPKIMPKTPNRTPPDEPETINAWELMDGLEDTIPLQPPHHLRSFSFHFSPNPIPSPLDQPTKKLPENAELSPKSLWLEIADDDSNSNSNAAPTITEFDPDVNSTFRKTLEELPPAIPFQLSGIEKQQAVACNNQPLEVTDGKKINSIGKEKVIVYFTSLRGVRKTFEDCCHIRAILKGLGVRVDERDVSMHSGFKVELKELLGDGFNGSSLPRVFVGKKYIGGAEEVRQMHEDGQLEKVVGGCETVVDDGGRVEFVRPVGI